MNTTDHASREEAWPELLEAMKEALGERPGEVSDVWLPYVLQALERWPDRLRVAPREWVNAIIRGEEVGVLMALVVAVHADRITNPRFQKMCARRDFTWVRHLHFGGVKLKLESARALGGSSAFENLRELSFYRARLGSLKIRAIMTNPFVRNLTSLAMSSCEIRGGDLAALFKIGDFPSLEHLDLSRNYDLDRPCIEALAQAELPSLRRLDLSLSWSTSEDLDLLLGASWLPALDELRLERSYRSMWASGRARGAVKGVDELNALEDIRQRVLDSGLRPEVAAAAAQTLQ